MSLNIVVCQWFESPVSIIGISEDRDALIFSVRQYQWNFLTLTERQGVTPFHTNVGKYCHCS